MKIVGVAGFEPTAPTPPAWCATRLRYTPFSVLTLAHIGCAVKWAGARFCPLILYLKTKTWGLAEWAFSDFF
jgi:hypothetical protein